jgi:2-methylisocitrate lyase-like PEP mutase family enzyme
MPTQQEKAQVFREMHEGPGYFVIPNPWDAGSARLLQGMGFKSLATTSSGFAYTLGRLDGQVTLDEKLAHCRSLVGVTDIPISADLENGFADDPAGVAKTIKRAAETGLVGGSIEDYDPRTGEIYEFGLAVERVEAAVEAARSLDFPFMLTARAENVLRRTFDLDEAIRRLQAFEAAGADVLYAPGLSTVEEVKLVVGAVGKPLNVLVGPMRGATAAEIGEAGAKRISVGGALAYASMAPILAGGEDMLGEGTFAWLAEAAPGGRIRELLG